MDNMIRVTADAMSAEFSRILRKNGFSEERSGKCAEIFTLNSLEGV